MEEGRTAARLARRGIGHAPLFQLGIRHLTQHRWHNDHPRAPPAHHTHAFVQAGLREELPRHPCPLPCAAAAAAANAGLGRLYDARRHD